MEGIVQNVNSSIYSHKTWQANTVLGNDWFDLQGKHRKLIKVNERKYIDMI